MIKKLKAHIEICHKGNVTEFSIVSGLVRQKTQRLIDMDCDINLTTGEITRTEVKHVCRWG